MKLIFEKSKPRRRCSIINDKCSTQYKLPKKFARKSSLRLPEVSEIDISRHYTELATRTYGVNKGFYPLGSCTMKYNPKINDEMANLPEFSGIHPLAPLSAVQGCMEVLVRAEKMLKEITGMDNITFLPAAGAHGEFTGILLIKAYHESRGDFKRNKIIVPDSAHGTNPATAAMAGYTVVNIPSDADGCVDLDKLREAVSDETAGIMLTNPNTLGIFDKNIAEITKIVHNAGGLNYYDGANLNAIMGIVRPGDMGFDVMHINLHKTFSTPHGGGGPGSGPVGCKAFLSKFLPDSYQCEAEQMFSMKKPECSIGRVKAFYGNFLIIVRALTYILTLGSYGIVEAAQTAVLNANYLRCKLSGMYDIPYNVNCMHEFVISLKKIKKEHGVSAMDIAKTMLDYGIHPPTMYFPLIVEEALMLEPTETESIEILDEAALIFKKIYSKALKNPDELHSSPLTAAIGRPDEIGAARNPKLKYEFT